MLESSWQTHLEFQQLLREAPSDWQPLVEPSRGPGARPQPCLPEPSPPGLGRPADVLGDLPTWAILLVLPFLGLAYPILASPPRVRCGPVTHPTCLPAQLLDAAHSAQALSVHTEVVSNSVCTLTHTNTHKRSLIFSSFYNMGKPHTKEGVRLGLVDSKWRPKCPF